MDEVFSNETLLKIISISKNNKNKILLENYINELFIKSNENIEIDFLEILRKFYDLDVKKIPRINKRMEIVLQLCFENRNLLNNFDELAVEVAKMQGIKDKFKVKKDIIYFFEYYNGLDHASLLYKKLDGTKKNLALIKNRLLYIINYIDNYLLDNDSIKKYFKNQDKNELFNTMFKTSKKNTPNELFIKESINILEKNEFNPLTINDIIDKINKKYHLALNKYSIYANLINDYSIYSLNPECDFLNDKNRDTNSFIQEYNIFLKYLYNIINIQKEKMKILKNE